jgi:hypothetical protein
MLRSSIFLGIVLAVTANAQQPVDPTVMKQLTAFIQDFARGVTENRFDVKSTITFYDRTGKQTKTANGKHLLEFVAGRFAGLNEGSEWNVTFRVSHANRPDLANLLYTDIGSFIPIAVMSPAERANWDFQLNGSLQTNGNLRGGALTLSYRSRKACSTFQPGKGGLSMLEGVFEFAGTCGQGQFVVDEDADIPLRTSMDGLGMPVVSGKKSMIGYHAEDEFRRVPMPGAKQPFLFPSKATTTYTYASGKVVVEDVYTISTAKK